MDGHSQCRCRRAKAWGKAGWAGFGTQAPFMGDAELNLHDEAVTQQKEKQGREAADNLSISNKQVSTWRDPGGSCQPREKQRYFFEPWQQALWPHPALLPAPPATLGPGDHLLHGLSWVLTLAQGLCRLVLTLAMKLSMQGMESTQGKQGHSSSLTASPPWPLLCTCLVRGQGFQRRWR